VTYRSRPTDDSARTRRSAGLLVGVYHRHGVPMVGDRISGWWRISVAGYIVTRRVAWVRSYVLCMAEFFSRVQQWGTLLTSCMLDPRLTYLLTYLPCSTYTQLN